MKLTNKEMNQFIHWAGQSQCTLMRLRQLIAEKPELDAKGVLTAGCQVMQELISKMVEDALK